MRAGNDLLKGDQCVATCEWALHKHATEYDFLFPPPVIGLIELFQMVTTPSLCPVTTNCPCASSHAHVTGDMKLQEERAVMQR
jgi:hypothetical protein